MTFEGCVTKGDLAAPGMVDLIKQKRRSTREELSDPFFQ
jgi:hypothetical protein